MRRTKGVVVELCLGDLVLKTTERKLAGPRGEAGLEPRVVQVLQALARSPAGSLSRTDLYQQCWGTIAVGDDSLNRTIYLLRKAIVAVGSVLVEVETVAAMGYLLRIAETTTEDTLEAARQSWRMGLARGDDRIISQLQAVLTREAGDQAEVWGMLALHLCRAAENAPIEDCEVLVRRCERAAERALSLDPRQPEARVALSSLSPIFGDWLGCRRRLLEVLDTAPQHYAARHELAVLEMSTGCISAAIPLICGLIEETPRAALVQYKRGYHLYCLGQLDDMDRLIDNGLQVWPGHAGLWQCRMFTLAFTGRADAALLVLEDEALRPPLPAGTLEFHRLALRALADGGDMARESAVAALVAQASWQSMAVAAIMYLCALDSAAAAMALCERYYLREGKFPVRLRYEPRIEASINEMHRRATQPLFLPVTATLRTHPQFVELSQRIGLTDYWESAGVTPDFLLPS